ncbi:uncharacterized protein LOC143911334 [Arctopsyche grandis]|uniref:uncharacterized protein LOC143911334 n=1 Tax=Arctopsyche grandis TaxID=121162 RepID=UPI00406D8470
MVLDVSKVSKFWTKTKFNQMEPKIVRIAFFVFFSLILSVSQSFEMEVTSLSPSKCITFNGINNKPRVECRGINSNDNLTAILEDEVENFSNGKRIIDQLYLYDLIVDDRKLAQNWIKSTNFNISSLIIISAEIDNIENSAFDGFVFERLTYLRLQNFKIDTLEEGTFEGLKRLKILTINSCKKTTLKKML